ncbi:MAG: binding domain protein excisionase family [Glaciihabitans sp.]|nr:binding domain protein excisionase family [Glaciihabitans sp.]
MEYNIRIEFDAPLDDSSAVAAITALESFDPAPSRSQLGRLEVVFSILAEDVGQAAVVGYRLASAFEARIVALDVLRTEDFDRINGFDPMPELINAAEAAGILGISAAAVGQKFTAGELPGQRVGERSIIFSRRRIEAIAGKRVLAASATEDPLDI